MKKALTLSITIIIMSILTIGVLSNSPSISSTDISLVNKVFAQESAQVFIAQGAADQSNPEPFVPPQLGVPIGSSVSWTNDDSIEHTVTADDGESFDSGPISPGDTFDNTFDSSGEFGYHCSIHPFMTGVVVVE
jgi:plastocyanin